MNGISIEVIQQAFSGAQLPILLAIWWELRHLRRTADDHENRLRDVEQPRRRRRKPVEEPA